jgi:hypothetical protein
MSTVDSDCSCILTACYMYTWKIDLVIYKEMYYNQKWLTKEFEYKKSMHVA